MFLKKIFFIFLFCVLSNVKGKPQNSEQTGNCLSFEDDGYRQFFNFIIFKYYIYAGCFAHVDCFEMKNLGDVRGCYDPVWGHFVGNLM